MDIDLGTVRFLPAMMMSVHDMTGEGNWSMGSWSLSEELCNYTKIWSESTLLRHLQHMKEFAVGLELETASVLRDAMYHDNRGWFLHGDACCWYALRLMRWPRSFFSSISGFEFLYRREDPAS